MASLSQPISPFSRLHVVALLGVLCLGCRTAVLPDPNDPRDVPADQRAVVLRQNIHRAADSINLRVLEGQISDQTRRQMLNEYAGELLKEGDADHCAPSDAWIYADLMLTSGRYSEAIPLLKKAIKYAESVKNDDRRVNDSLRLARCLALTGNVGEALNLTQAVIDSKPSDPGPVLPSVLLEITPAAEGKGHDVQLAKLLEEAIHEHLRMKVDPKSEAGQMFIYAKTHHIRNAWMEIISLLLKSGKTQEAQAAQMRAGKMMEQLDKQFPESL